MKSIQTATTTTVCEDYEHAGIILQVLGRSPGEWNITYFAGHMECWYGAEGADLDAAVALLIDLALAIKPNGTHLSLTDEGVRLYNVGTVAELICVRYLDDIVSKEARYTVEDIREGLYSSELNQDLYPLDLNQVDAQIIVSALNFLSSCGHLDFDGKTARIDVDRSPGSDSGLAEGIFDDLFKAFACNPAQAAT